jgi:multidrug efflux pump
VFLFGQRDYSMRVWVDPMRLAARNLTAADVAQAIREQNAALATGMIGQQPVPAGQETAITLDTLGRLKTVEQFQDLIVRTDALGRVTRVKDVARVELGPKAQDVSSRIDGHETVFLAIFQLPDANALDTAARVEAKMNDLKRSFPEDVDWDIGFTTVPYTVESLREVVKTLRDAIILVALVVLLFLQNWRSTLIPLIAVPVAIMGTFAVMAAVGFSLNNLTMFGLVLAIGIVVDDAIVVVEAVEHHIEHGLPPREATIEAMKHVSGPVVAVGLVLSAVFVPCAFIGGITGLFFQQFALTIAVSTLLSAFNSLTLSPALAALLLKPRDKRQAVPLPWPAYLAVGGIAGYLFLPPVLAAGLGRWPAASAALAGAPEWALPAEAAAVGAVVVGLLAWPLNRALRWVFRAFNAGFRGTAGLYTRAVGGLLRVSGVALVVYVGLLALTYGAFAMTPRGFIPQQDMGYLMVAVQLPDAASTERTDAVMRQMEKIARATPGVRHESAIVGQSFALGATGPNYGSMFINLQPYSQRTTPDLSSDAVIGRLMREFGKITDAMIVVFPPPPVRGVGRAGGFSFVIEDRGDLGAVALQRETENLMVKGNQHAGLTRLITSFRANVPQLHVQPNTVECASRGVRIGAVNDTLVIYQGSLYINDFNLFGRTWQVIVQSDAPYRTEAEQLYRLKVRNERGVMVPLGSLVDVEERNGPLVLTRYNMYSAATINGSAAPGTSSGQAMDIMMRMADRELPPSMAYEWTEISYLEKQAGNRALEFFAYAAIAVFLVLAAQYESWSLPLAVILVVPLCLLSAVAGVQVAHQDVNVFTQIGFVVLVGLTSKNAILIVEFAKHSREEGGLSRRDAALAACKLRLRPIVMTSVAFVLGVVPLLVSHGAGFEMRRTLGTTVFAGMIGVTVFGLLLTPVFFFVIDWLGGTRLFRSRELRVVSGVVLAALTLGLHRLGPALLRRNGSPEPPSTNGPDSAEMDP